jgi:hypothetical protein
MLGHAEIDPFARMDAILIPARQIKKFSLTSPS